MKRPGRLFNISMTLLLSITLANCAGDQGQDGELEGGDEYGQQGGDEGYNDQEGGGDEGYNDQEGGGDEGNNDQEGGEEGGNGGENYGNEGGGNNYAQESEEGGNNYAQGEQPGENNASNFEGQQETMQNNALGNSFQNQEGMGEGINNAVGDEYAAEAQNTEMAATDAAMTEDVGEEMPMEEEPAPTYMPGEIPAGWARTQNGLFINLSDLTDEPTGYNEMDPMWQ